MNITDLPAPLLSISAGGGTAGHGTLLSVDPGVRNVVSDFGDPSQGATAAGPITATWVAPDLIGNKAECLLVATRFGGINHASRLSLVDPETGRRRLLSDFGDSSQGAPCEPPIATVVLPPLTDIQRNAAALALIPGNNDTGSRIVSIGAFGQRRPFRRLGGDILHGPWTPSAMAYLPATSERADSLIVGGTYLGGNRTGVLVRVDPDHDSTSFFSFFADSGQGWTPPASAYGALEIVDIAVSPGQAIYTLVEQEHVPASDPCAAIVRVDPLTGQRQLVSNLLNEEQGPVIDEPNALALLTGGSLALSDISGGTDSAGAIFLVDPQSGKRTLLSDLGAEGQGPRGLEPLGLVQPP